MSTISTLSEEEKSKYLEELFEFLKLPSVSADSKFSKYMNTTANWLSNELLKSGCDTIYWLPETVFDFLSKISQQFDQNSY